MRRFIVLGLVLLLAACGEPSASQQATAFARIDAGLASGRPTSAIPESTAVPPGFISRTMLGDAWPLTVESGILKCLEGRLVVFDADNGKTYAVNGTAIGTKRWPQIRELSVPTDLPGAIKSLQPLLDRGLPLC